MFLSFLLVQTAAAQDLNFAYPVTLGEGEKPGLYVTPPRVVGTLEVDCEVAGEHHRFTGRNLSAGVENRYEWPRNPSVTEARCMVRAVFGDGMVEEVQLPLSYAYGGGLSVDLSRAEADHQAHTMSVDVTAWVERAEVVAYGAHREVLGEQSFPINQGPGRIEIPWVGEASEVVLLDVKLHGERAWVTFSYSPWMLDIPHNDVLFASNESSIATEEEWKLHDTLRELKEVLDKYGEIVPVKLYIGGCTDTVGTQDSNRTLSRRRARAIATWLRSNGYDHPVFYYGFGESWLARQTGDGVDEPSNRRAIYIVTANPPPPSSGVPQVNWIPL